MMMKIALLEDNPAIVELIEDALEMQGYQVTTFACGQELLHALLASRNVGNDPTILYDLLIVDYLLPGDMTGGEVIAVLRERYAESMLPIILISGAHPADLAEVQTQFPDVTILQKPFAIKALLTSIEQTTTSKVRR
jgi:CheY-like chemotaxis protein